MKKNFMTDKAPQPVGPYSQAISFKELIFISGQIGIDVKTGKLVDGIENQTQKVMENIKNILEEAGLNFGNVLKTTIFLTNMADFPKVNEIYSSYLKEPYPARSTIEVKSLPKGALIEIEVIAGRW